VDPLTTRKEIILGLAAAVLLILIACIIGQLYPL
jgi:hypothetical protein